jgi:hypothetical protein
VGVVPNNVAVQPIAGGFDVAAVRSYLEAKPDVLLDPLGSGTYLLIGLGSPAAKGVLGRNRVADPSRFPYTTLILVTAERVDVYVEYSHREERGSAREFVTWLAGRQPCRITDEYGRDLTGWTQGGAAPDAEAWIPDWYDPLPVLGPRLVLECTDDAVATVDAAAVAWRVEWPDGAPAQEFAAVLERLLEAVGADNLRGLVIGVSEPWPDPAPGVSLPAALTAVVPLLADLAPRLPALTGLALFDIVSYDLEPTANAGPAAWHTPVDTTTLLAAFPRLEILHVYGVARPDIARAAHLQQLSVYCPP